MPSMAYVVLGKSPGRARMGKWELAAKLVRQAIIEEDQGRHDDAAMTRLHIDLLIGHVLMSGRWYGGREMVADVRQVLRYV